MHNSDRGVELLSHCFPLVVGFLSASRTTWSCCSSMWLRSKRSIPRHRDRPAGSWNSFRTPERISGGECWKNETIENKKLWRLSLFGSHLEEIKQKEISTIYSSVIMVELFIVFYIFIYLSICAYMKPTETIINQLRKVCLKKRQHFRPLNLVFIRREPKKHQKEPKTTKKTQEAQERRLGGPTAKGLNLRTRTVSVL